MRVEVREQSVCANPQMHSICAPNQGVSVGGWVGGGGGVCVWGGGGGFNVHMPTARRSPLEHDPTPGRAANCAFVTVQTGRPTHAAVTMASTLSGLQYPVYSNPRMHVPVLPPVAANVTLL
jgi:hypothetical protein